MAVLKPTRSPWRAQLPAFPRKRRRLPKPVERLPVYENLHALNRTSGKSSPISRGCENSACSSGMSGTFCA